MRKWKASIGKKLLEKREVREKGRKIRMQSINKHVKNRHPENELRSKIRLGHLIRGWEDDINQGRGSLLYWGLP